MDDKLKALESLLHRVEKGYNVYSNDKFYRIEVLNSNQHIKIYKEELEDLIALLVKAKELL